ncbi:unnamed protein product [Rotaria sp. Silwood2]|nr:unnamed protein product [Rotaria sp. Silwood2]CAF3216117.1 unnamed protein product [Rotaria sp. Silwood2]CAF3372741.1 unnamed protein product [Rotaria sp. Silwood2]CAF3561078.1 unnamed protein product [Rotaria sp. Silwood2]CAF4176674.1 unnamed protein product [Rotaria sp. Silwood2]
MNSGIDKLIGLLICASATEDCYSKHYDRCVNQYPSSTVVKSNSTSVNDEDDEITWFNWVRISGKVHLEEINSNAPALLDNVDEQ